MESDRRVTFVAAQHDATHIPYIWRLKGNHWVPVQFFHASTPTLSARLEKAKAHSAFLEEFSATLLHYKAEDEIGLQLVFDDLLGLQLDSEIVSEATDCTNRLQEMIVLPSTALQHEKIEEKNWVTVTAWRFTKGDPEDPIGLSNCWCWSHCSGGGGWHGDHILMPDKK